MLTRVVREVTGSHDRPLLPWYFVRRPCTGAMSDDDDKSKQADNVDFAAREAPDCYPARFAIPH